MPDLRTKTARTRLKPNSNGHAENLATGRALLYRKRTATQPGKWVLRTAKAEGGYSFETLGTADDASPADGVKVLSYAQALEAALGRTVADPTKVKVEQALDDWAKTKKRTASSDKQRLDIDSAARRLKEAFPRATLKSLTARQIKTWMDARVDEADNPRARMATVNRQLAILKAACTAAADDHGFQGKRTWTDVKKYEKAEAFGKRMAILSEDDEDRLIAAAEPDIALMLTALQMTGARFGEMRSALVGDLEGDKLDLTGKTGKRTITLSPRIAEWFADQAGDRPAALPLIAKSDGSGWPDGGQLKPTRRAVKAADLPNDVTTYALRHGFISRALARGVPIAAIAEFCGTSVQMITDNYAKFTPAQAKEWFA
ncbi:tyrosine-type recombinase/integrase [Phaeobacter marinintestinus]|uniref:tyrosine-type recombinase/integrase n=1 Tax=Falsiphaeobacter marinintestinus TaxID=1492905 RepID=UPI0011B75642|nr:tyrosine-type recombinase/integrase [Phaeobacter marinintestinus]